MQTWQPMLRHMMRVPDACVFRTLAEKEAVAIAEADTAHHTVLVVTGSAITRPVFAHDRHLRVWLMQIEQLACSIARARTTQRTATDRVAVRFARHVPSRVEIAFEAAASQARTLQAMGASRVRIAPVTWFAPAKTMLPRICCAAGHAAVRVGDSNFRFAAALLGKLSNRQRNVADLFNRRLAARHLFTGTVTGGRLATAVQNCPIVVLIHPTERVEPAPEPDGMRTRRRRSTMRSRARRPSVRGPTDTWMLSLIGNVCAQPPLFVSELPDDEADVERFRGAIRFTRDPVSFVSDLIAQPHKLKAMMFQAAAWWEARRAMSPGAFADWWGAAC